MHDALFPDLGSAGQALAPILKPCVKPDVIVLGLVRGGVPVAVEVARALSLPLDIVLLRRLMAPHGPADVLMAAWTAGNFVIDERLPAAANAVQGGAAFLSDALAAFAARNELCRGPRPPAVLRDTTVLLIDNGARTGGTMRAAVRALRTLEPARIVAATPVASSASRAVLHAAADEVVCLQWIEQLGHVGMAYDNYAVPHFEQIHSLLPA